MSAFHPSPAQAYASLIAGLLLIYVECCRPGTVLPGAAGSVLFLLSLSRIAEFGFTADGLVLIAAGLALIAIESILRWPGIPGMAGAVVLAAGVTRLAQQRPISWSAALPLSLLFAAVTVVLGSLAWRGYWAKRL